MPYFEPTTQHSIYYCPNCRAWYQRGNISCCVLHAAGECCHMGEMVMEKPNKAPAHWRKEDSGR